VGYNRTSGDEEDTVRVVLSRAASVSDVLHQDQARLRILHLHPRHTVPSALHPRHTVPSALLPDARHLLAASRVACQDDPR